MTSIEALNLINSARYVITGTLKDHENFAEAVRVLATIVAEHQDLKTEKAGAACSAISGEVCESPETCTKEGCVKLDNDKIS